MPPRHDAGRSEKFRYEYGAGPLHLIAVIASLAIALYAILRILEIPFSASILLWLGAAIVLHDFIALPIYSLFLRLAEEGAEAALPTRRRELLWLNHVRIPAAFSALLLLISFPLIFQIDEPRYELTTGLDLDRYLGNWLLITAVMFAISGIWLALKLRSRAADRPMIGFERVEYTEPPKPPGRALRWAARGTLAAGALLSLFVIALVIYGLIASFPDLNALF